ncbi:MAG: ABC transporter permease [Verrucomicrobiales bacterium]|nr:ABC transporter permease [Verrucomicrobiales bacterium]
MTLLPVVERELRVASRRWTTFWLRLLAAVAFVLMGMGAIMTANFVRGTPSGVALFQTLSGLCFVLCCVAGPILAADILSAEKRQGTLGLLFLTDLKPIDVVLGKLAAVSINAAAAVLASLPVFALAFLLGGITLPVLVAVALALFNALAFSLVVTVIVSACCVEGRSALALSAFVVGCAVFLLPNLGEFAPSRVTPHLSWSVILSEVFSLLRQLSPVTVMDLVLSDNRKGNPLNNLQFLNALVLSQTILWLSLFLAGSMLKRAWRGEGRLGGNGGLWPWMARWMFGGSETRRVLRRRLLDRNPWTWLVCRNVLKRRIFIWGLTPVLPLYAVVGRRLLGDYGHDAELTLVLAYVLQLLLKVLVASEASHLFAENRRAGSFELLLTTSLGEREIVRGHAASVRRLFAWPVLVTLVTTALLVAPQTEGWQFPVFLLVAALLIWDMEVLIWVGMWRGLVQKRAHLAAFSAMLRVLFWPSLLAGVTAFFATVADPAFPFIFALAVYAMFNLAGATASSAELRQELRSRVAEQFQSERSGA